jgi:hypothetical protein
MRRKEQLLSAAMQSAHEKGLRWFQQHAGHTVTWQQLQDGPCLLVTTAKGIFKPKDLDYALSVRQTLDSPYPDEEPVFQDDGSWTYRYAQEGTDSDPEHLYTNRGLIACKHDNIPVGVLRQLSRKPDATCYEVLGLATVVSWNNGIFTLKSTVLDDAEPPPSPLLHIASPLEPYGFDPNLVQDARLKVMQEVIRRQGQKPFRSGLLTAYQGRCAITGCAVEPVLEAAHITPYLGPQTNKVTNGLLLRSDIHTLWDTGLMFLDADYRVHVQPTLSDSEYVKLQGQSLTVPSRYEIRPSEKAIRAHREWCLAKGPSSM